MGNSHNGCSVQLGINLNSGWPPKRTRVRDKVGFGKRVKQGKKFGGGPPHKIVMDGVEERDFFIIQNLLEDQDGAIENFGPSPKFSQNLDCRKLPK